MPNTPADATVLLVEDSPSDAAWLSAMLDVPVVHATSIAEARQVLDEGGAGLVLLDLGLPDADGMSGLAALRERFDGPIIVLTGHDEADFGPASVRHGAQEFLGKDGLDAVTLRLAMRYARERHQQALQVTRAQQRLQRYARAVAHDLRSPLTTVQGFADLIVADQRAADPEGSAAGMYAERIVVTVARLAAMLDQLLVDAESTAEEQTVDLTTVVDAALQVLADDLDARRATVTVGRMPTLWGRAASLQQVVLNLVANSLRHAGVDRPHVHIGAQQTGDGGWEVTVEDDGTAVDDELIAMGQPLQAARLKPRGDGHGFGLRAVAMVVEEHDGQTWLQRTDAGGLRVVLRFPSSRVLPPEPAPGRG